MHIYTSGRTKKKGIWASGWGERAKLCAYYMGVAREDARERGHVRRGSTALRDPIDSQGGPTPQTLPNYRPMSCCHCKSLALSLVVAVVVVVVLHRQQFLMYTYICTLKNPTKPICTCQTFLACYASLKIIIIFFCFESRLAKTLQRVFQVQCFFFNIICVLLIDVYVFVTRQRNAAGMCVWEYVNHNFSVR